ncbi:MAG TPA: pitrilysin family protein [Tissierellales bacterium]|nr:pitrilysin family protein [Tissierellales bacterium]
MKTKLIEKTNLDEKILFDRTNEGLQVYFIPKEGYVKRHAIFATNYGSNDNKFMPRGATELLEVPEGIAHFLEHKLFEEPEINIFDKFSKLGANVNAYTSSDQTAYLFSTTDNFYESLKLLINFVQNPYFTDENVEKEKGIIEQEIRMYEDSPQWKVYFNCLNGMYVDHPIKIDIAGTVDSIQGIDKDLLYKSYNTFYHPSNMVLIIVGDLSFDKIMEVVNNTEKENSIEGDNNIVRIYPDEPKFIREKYIEEKLVTSAPLFTIGFKDDNIGVKGEELIKKEILTNIMLEMLFGESTEFYQKLYGDGLIDESFGSYYTGSKNYGHTMMAGMSKDPEKVLDLLLTYIKKRKQKGLTEDAFQRIKNKNIGYFLMGLNSTDFIANSFIHFYMKDFMLLNYLDTMSKIEYNEIINRFQSHLTKDNYTLSVIKPME